MLKNEIKVFFGYEGEPEEKFTFKENEKIKDVCLHFASKKGILFDSVYFMFDGNVLVSSKYNKPLKAFINGLSGRELHILVKNRDNPNYINSNKKIKVIFIFESEPEEIEFPIKTKMEDVFKFFANKKGKNIHSLYFEYRNKKVDSNKIIEELAVISDINRGKLEMIVKENNIDINPMINGNQISSINPIIRPVPSFQANQILQPSSRI